MTISNVSKRMKRYSRTTLILLSVSSMYLLLHFPLATSKMYYIFKEKSSSASMTAIFRNEINTNGLFDSIKTLRNQSFYQEMRHNLNESVFFYQETQQNSSLNKPLLRLNPFENLVGRFANNVYYLNFVLNFFLYSLNMPMFRSVFCKKKFQNNDPFYYNNKKAVLDA